MVQPEHIDGKCTICHLTDCQNNHSNKTNADTSKINRHESCLTEEYESEHNSTSHISKTNNQDWMFLNIGNNVPHSQSGNKVEKPGDDVTENIARILKIIGDNLDSTANDCLSNDIVCALRNIGDDLDVKLGFQKQSFIMATLGASRMNIGHVWQQLLRPQSLVGTVLCTSLQLLLHYKRL